MNERDFDHRGRIAHAHRAGGLLAAEGYRVLTAAEGEAGLERALDEKPDLILLDIMMPRLDGFAVCAELRRLANPVPVLMLTAKGQIDDRVRVWTPARMIIWSNPSAPTNCWRACAPCCGAWSAKPAAAEIETGRRGN